MSDPENFLTRWSRRKRAVADDSDHAPRGAPAQPATEAPPVEHGSVDPSLPPSDAGSASAEPAFDLTKLPPIESITAETDIRAFLAPGVPAELRLAALRRAWVADPKVRDFIGLNDYDFDFHTPGAIPGFGPLQMTDALRQEVVRIVSGWRPEPESGAPTAPTVAAPEVAASPAEPAAMASETSESQVSVETTGGETAGPASDHSPADQDKLMGDKATTPRTTQYVALQQEHLQTENLQILARRAHGRALPE